MFEKHCVKVITDCYKRKYAIKLSETLVTQILINEKSSFDYPWLKNVEFSNRYVQRFMMEHDLVWTGKKAYFSTPKHYVPDSAPGFVSIWYSEKPILQLADARNPSKWSGGLEH